MKILELHYSTAAAGAERLVIDLSNELSRNNELVLCTTDDDSIWKTHIIRMRLVLE